MLSDREHAITLSAAKTKVAANTLAERYSINGHRVILYAGTFEPYQGLDLLVHAAKEIIPAYKNVRFLCVGGDKIQIGKIKSLAGQYGVSEYFVFPGTVTPEAVQSFFKIASILISPRISGTNTPLKIYSYLRSGLPIVATRIVSHTQVLNEDVALLVDPHPVSVGRGILRLLTDEGLGKRLAENALRLAENDYSADAYYRKMAEVLSFLSAKRNS